jgi:hypothetical protein
MPKEREMFIIRVELIKGGTHKFYEVYSIEVSNGLLIVNMNNLTKVYPLSNIKCYEFSKISGD